MRFNIRFLLFFFCVAVLKAKQPNILIMISDDQSFAHTSAMGSKMVTTPNFDRVANEGVLFTNAVCASPGCSPSRAAFLTGRQTWQIEHAGNHASSFGKEYVTFVELLEKKGYHAGYVGKGWSPGNWKVDGREKNPAGKSYGGHKQPYEAAFAKFLSERPDDAPFVFWFGSSDPHRGFEKGSGLESGMKLEDAEVPPFLPDTPEIRSDLLDYTFEVNRFDRDCGAVLKVLEETGELDNTIIIVTSDNGMAFPYAKANCNEYGIHIPLAISWKAKIPAGQKTDRPVSLIDVTAMIHEATGIEAPEKYPLAGVSFYQAVVDNNANANEPKAVYSSRERHSSSRYQSLGYPQRAMRTKTHLYIRNFKPERWPAGPGQKYLGKPGSKLSDPHASYADIDPCPTLDHMIEHRDKPEIKNFFDLAVAHRPAEELYDIINDPGCLVNLATKPEHQKLRSELANNLTQYLTRTQDARVVGDGNVFETYRRYSHIRWFPLPDWAEKKPDSVPEVPWLESRK